VEKTPAITDVAMPSENHYAPIEAVRKEKRIKYDHVTGQYQQQGYDVFVDAFFIVALGGWDPVNRRILVGFEIVTVVVTN
jgi:hypothetical protein